MILNKPKLSMSGVHLHGSTQLYHNKSKRMNAAGCTPNYEAVQHSAESSYSHCDPWREQNISNTKLRETVKRELMTNTCYYVEFVAATSKLHVETDNLLEHGIYNADSVDLVIAALCSAVSQHRRHALQRDPPNVKRMSLRSNSPDGRQ